MGQATGLWGEMRALWGLAYDGVFSRVLSPQNRTHLTQSPRRASKLLVTFPGFTPVVTQEITFAGLTVNAITHHFESQRH